MEYPIVRAKIRTITGKGAARKIRALGYVPAILYGKGKETVPIVIDPKEMLPVFYSARGANSVLRLEVEDSEGAKESTLAIIRDYAVHPYKRVLEHCDLMRVDETTELTVRVPFKFVGRSEGEKLGGRLNVAIRRVTLKCPASMVPEAVVVDVTPIKIGHTLSLSQITYPEGTRPVFTKDAVVLSIRMPKGEKAVTEEATAGPKQEGESAEKPPAKKS